MKKERLDKLIASQGLLSRNDVKTMVKRGEVSVNGAIVKDSSIKVSYEDDIKIKGESLSQTEYVYIMLNKPKGVVSASEDKRDKTVVDILPDELKRKNLFPAGRLDKDTEGLLIICNDGELCHNLLSPKKHVEKTYYVCLDKLLSMEAEEQVCTGVYIEKDVKSMPATLERITDDKVHLTIQEGKFHQVKKMFHAVGLEVIYLKRISMGGLKLDESLKEGDFRPLTLDEINYLKGLTNV